MEEIDQLPKVIPLCINYFQLYKMIFEVKKEMAEWVTEMRMDKCDREKVINKTKIERGERINENLEEHQSTWI